MTESKPKFTYSKDRWFHDENGKLVLAQTPNPPLIVWAAARLAQILVTSGRPERVLDVIATGALFTWAWLELFEGNAYFRRILGAAGLVFIVVTQTHR